MAIPSTRDRVPLHTAHAVNEQIECDIEASIFAHSADPEQISDRLKKLDEEWDVECTIEANASTLAFIGVVLGYFVHPYWLALPALVTAFLSSMPFKVGALPFPFFAV